MTVGRRLAVAGIAAAIVAVVVAGCGVTSEAGQSFAVASIGPGRTVSPGILATRAQIVQALGQHNLVLADTQSAVRPAEAPLLSAAARAVYQVLLPKDPTHGYIVVYEFPDTARAAAAAAEEQSYLATGPGRVQTPQGTVTVIRQLGNSVILYSWLPGASTDDSAPGIQSALESIGVGFPIAG
jgi:hypothetical protein